jgi:hypothetical protein
MERLHLTAAETAKLIRPVLAKQFPGVKFSIRSRTYAGGASIDINWTDGPRAKMVDRIVKGFEGASFDSMNDLKSDCESWLLPDGTAKLAARPESYGGSVPGYISDAPHPKARLVSFMADFVFTHRDISNFDERQAKATLYIRAHCHCEGELPNLRFGNEWVDTLANRMAQDWAEGETIDQTFARALSPGRRIK